MDIAKLYDSYIALGMIPEHATQLCQAIAIGNLSDNVGRIANVAEELKDMAEKDQ